MQELSYRLSRLGTNSPGCVFSTLQEWSYPSFMYCGFGKTFCNDGWLIEFNAKTEMDYRMNQPWKSLPLELSFFFFFFEMKRKENT